MTGDDEEAMAADAAPARRAAFRALGGGLAGDEPGVAAASPPPPVRLWREWKGVTTTDLHCQDLVAKLPGRKYAATDARDRDAAIHRRDVATTRVFAGPGHARSPHWLPLLVVGIAAVVAAIALASWIGA